MIVPLIHPQKPRLVSKVLVLNEPRKSNTKTEKHELHLQAAHYLDNSQNVSLTVSRVRMLTLR